MTDERRRLLEALGNQGAEGEALAERYGPDYAEELNSAIADGDVRTHTYHLRETGAGGRFDTDPPLYTFHLTPQGAERVGIDPNTLIG